MNIVPPYVNNGDFGLVHMGGDGGKWIRLAQFANGDGFADFEHAFVYVGDNQIIEAEPTGAAKHPYHYNEANVLWSSKYIKLTQMDRMGINYAAHNYIGTPYSADDYVALAAYRLHLKWAPGLKTFVGNSKSMICSQLVDQCYQDAGVTLFDDKRWPGYVTPGSLYQLLKSKGAK